MERRTLRAGLVVTVALHGAACERTIRTNNPPEPQPQVQETHNPPEPRIPPPMNPPAPDATCPPTAPTATQPCPRPELRCTYEACGMPDGITATCTAQGWRVDIVTCNPPPLPVPTPPTVNPPPVRPSPSR